MTIPPLRSLRTFSGKVFLAVLGVLILLTCTFSLFSLLSLRDNFRKEQDRTGRVLTRMIAENARLAIFALDKRQLVGPVNAVLEVMGVAGVCVFTGDGTLLLRRTDPAWEPSAICRQPPSLPELAKISAGETMEAHIAKELTEEFWSPVLAQSDGFTEEQLYYGLAGEDQPAPRLIGSVAVVFDRNLLKMHVRDTLVRHAMILIFFLGIGIFAAYYLVEAVTTPLNRLVGAIRAKEGLAGKRDGDDLGLLSTTFDSMLKDLGDSFCTINELKSGLERKVGELEKEVANRKQIEAALRESERKFRTISEGIADGVAIVRDHALVWANQAFCAIFDCCATDVVGQDPAILLPQPGKMRESPWLLDTLGGGEKQVRYLTMTRRRDGQEIMVEVKAQRIIFENQKAIQVIIRDITEQDRAETRRKELEIKALAQSKLASLGRIATAVAHEINQPLSYIKIAYESALRDLNEMRFNPTESRECFQEALRQVGRISTITDHLRNFGRADTSTFTEVRLVEVVNNSLTLMNEILRLANVALERDIPEELPTVRGNSVQLEQVLLNLFQNSVDAMMQASDRRIRLTMRANNGGVEICFADSGPGIPMAARQKIFEPFYSTKIGEDRTGLGLAIVNSIIRGHGGTIAYRELAGWGANFVITLPAGPLAEEDESSPLGQGTDYI
ncbi:MAG: PAS domain-containing sensor histidine kinase [Desulfobulbaceae bacterium]